MNSWADIVKFGQRKAPVGRPVKTKVNKTTVKKAVCKPQVKYAAATFDSVSIL